MFLEIKLLTPEKILYAGKASKVILPGEEGVFEVLAHHKSLISRLLSGKIIVDKKIFPIKRGIVKVDKNRIIIIVEEP
ncbi:MAG: F0F1 ATP synthase subunit epsilon [Candidatus Omnitrophica bacterium]|nr:F0F1 ATP synthase subunit epsilon [Candidatus Omnitrophota bacterium]